MAKQLDAITRWDVDKWRSTERKREIGPKRTKSPATINRDVTALNAALSKAVEWGLIDKNPLAKVKPIKTDSRGVIRLLSSDEEIALRGALDTLEQGLRDGRDSANEWRRMRGYPLMPDISAATLADHVNDCPEADVLIDFTAPVATLQHAGFVAERGMAMVIGTTGFDSDQLQQLRDTLSGSAVVMAANYSVGVNLALSLIEKAARVLGDDYDAEIFEAHHKHKVDAPSGTALAMGQSLAAGRGVPLDDVAVLSREGITGARKTGSIGFSVVRGGNIVGEHKAMFIADEERIEINHIASDRMVFARGAVRAANWLAGQSCGWYDMHDVLELHEG